MMFNPGDNTKKMESRGNVLLVGSSAFINNKERITKSFGPQLGLYYLKSLLSKDGFKVYIVGVEKPIDIRYLNRIILIKKISHVGVAVHTNNWLQVCMFLRRIQEDCPSIHTIAGGPHATLNPKKVKKLSNADTIIIGDIGPGITEIFAQRKRGIFRLKNTRLDQLPSPYLFENKVFKNYGFLSGIKFARNCCAVVTSRGCPHTCSFCSRTTLYGYQERNPKNVVKEIELLYNKGYTGAILYDDNFLANPIRAKKIAEQIIEKRIKMDFAFEGQPMTKPRIWEKLAKANFCLGLIGVEHNNQNILRYFNKAKQARPWEKKVFDTLSLMNRMNIFSVASIVLGAPMENEEMAEKLLYFLEKCRTDKIRANELVYIYGTSLWTDLRDKGYIDSSRVYVPSTAIFKDKKYIKRIQQKVRSKSFKPLCLLKKYALCSKNDKTTPLFSAMRLGYHKKAYYQYGIPP